MLYIASAQPPTPVLQSLLVPNFTAQGSSSLLVAKPDRLELWGVGKTGLSWLAELEIWGSIVAIEQVITKDARPHVAILQGPPNAHVLVIAYSTESNAMVVTHDTPLSPPTPSLRQAEFFRSMIVQDNTLLVSLWVGVLSCIELEVEKDKDSKRRRSSVAVAPVDMVPDKRLRIRETYNINIREQNLLSLAFHPGTPSAVGPVVSFLSLTPQNNLHLHMRAFSAQSHSFTDLVKPMDMVAPGMSDVTYEEDTDYGAIPFSCPGARRILPIPTQGTEKKAIIIGDEYTVLYAFGPAASPPRDPGSSPTSSPRGSAANRSPQAEMKQLGKRRKSSTGGGGGHGWELRPIWRIRQGFGTVLAATSLVSNPHGGVVLMSDDSGRLKGMVWETDHDTEGNSVVQVNKLDLGTTSPASCLTYLNSDHLFLSSACADSQLLKLSLPSTIPPGSPVSPKSSPRSPVNRKGKGRANHNDGQSGSIVVGSTATGSTEVLERWMNLAPVKDFAVVGDESGGTSHLVVASGASNANSVRSVRSGAGLESLVNIEGISGVERIWSLKHEGQSSLLLSTAHSTMLLQFSPDITEAELGAGIASSPTLAAALLPGSPMLIHVAASGVSIWSDVTNGSASASWQAPAEITAASIHNDQLAVSTRGGKVHILKATTASLDLVVSSDIEAEVSSIAIFSSEAVPSPFVAVGIWAHEILLYDLNRLQAGSSPAASIKEDHFASSLMLKPTILDGTSSVQLLAGLSDGSLATYDIGQADNAGGIVVNSRKSSSLGTCPLTLHPISGTTETGEEELLALGLSERTSVLFESRDRVDFSSVNLKDITAAASTTLPAYGNCIVLASPTGLSISKVNGLKKLHIQTLDLEHRSVNKLAYLSSYNVMACGAVERHIDQESGDYWQKAYFELRDPATLRVMAEITLPVREEVTCLVDVMLLGRRYIAIGTAIHSEEDEDDIDEAHTRAKEGRVMLVSPDFDQPPARWTINTECEIKTVGAVRDITTVHGFLAVAAASKVSIHRYETGKDLVEVSSFASTFIAQSLCTSPPSRQKTEETLIVGDGMRSILILDVDEESGKIWGDDRDMATHQVSTLSNIYDQGPGVVVADGFSNVLTFRVKDRIEPAATFGLHEEVIRFQSGSFAPRTTASEVIYPDLVFATYDGRLGMIGELSDSAAKVLDDLQRNMDKYHKGPGGISWRTFRKGGTPLVQRDTAGFVDGDFVQKFPNMDLLGPSTSEKILKGGNVHEHITRFGADGKAENATRADVMSVLEAAGGLH